MVAVVAAATLARLALNPFVVGTQFPTFFLAAILCTFLGGICIGLLSIPLSTLAVWYFFGSRTYTFVLPPREAAALAAFVVIALLMVFIVGSLQTAFLAIDGGLSRERALRERAQVADELRVWSDYWMHCA